MPGKFPTEIYEQFLEILDLSDCFKCFHVSREFWKISRRITFREINILTRIPTIIGLLEDPKYSIIGLVESVILHYNVPCFAKGHPIGSHIIKLLCKAPRLKEVTIQRHDKIYVEDDDPMIPIQAQRLRIHPTDLKRWERLPETMQYLLPKLFKLPTLRSLTIRKVSKIPAQALSGTHVRILKIEDGDIGEAALLKLPQLKELYAHNFRNASASLKTSVNTLEVLYLVESRILHNDDEDKLNLSSFKNLRSVQIEYDRYRRRGVDEGGLADLPLFCDAYLRPSAKCQSLEELAVGVDLNQVEATLASMTTQSRENYRILDEAIAHPALSNASIQLILVCHAGTDLFELQNGGFSSGRLAQIRGLFPAINSLDRATIKVSVCF